MYHDFDLQNGWTSSCSRRQSCRALNYLSNATKITSIRLRMWKLWPKYRRSSKLNWLYEPTILNFINYFGHQDGRSGSCSELQSCRLMNYLQLWSLNYLNPMPYERVMAKIRTVRKTGKSAIKRPFTFLASNQYFTYTRVKNTIKIDKT